MSYEGYEELICKRGHQVQHDAHFDGPDFCPFCRRLFKEDTTFAFYHSVDQTNDSGTPAKVKEIGYDLQPMKDFLGNTYYMKIDRVEPDDDLWREC